MDRSPDGVRLQIDTARRKNLKALKLCADPWWMDDLAHNGRLLLDPREEAGPEARIIVDAQLAYRTAEEGLSLIPLLLEAGVWFLEAPLSLDDYPGPRPHGRPRIDLGVGDLGLTHVLEFIEMMDHGGADICQPDISQVGGFTASLKSPPPRTTATSASSLTATRPRSRSPQTSTSLPPIPKRISSSTPSAPRPALGDHHRALPIESDGCVRVPKAPSLGVSLDPCIVAKYRWPPQQP